jgi:hypothetical protein
MQERDQFAERRGIGGIAGFLESLFDACEAALEMGEAFVPFDRRNDPRAWRRRRGRG